MDYQVGNETYRIRITDHILDNIYGQVGLTEVEQKLERLPIFKRLHSISQLGLVNVIFPCALHTRYIHSIGVMHIAGEMATRINSNMGNSFFDDSDIQIIRLAGMLHDIGHYPMSHNVEQAYKDSERMPKYENEAVSENLKYYVNCPDFLMPEWEKSKKDKIEDQEAIKTEKLREEEEFVGDISGSTNFHHEHIGSSIISKNEDIHKMVRDYFVLLTVTVDGEKKKVLNPKFSVFEKGEEARTSVTDEEVDEITSKLLMAIAEMVRGNYTYKMDSRYPWIEKYSAMIQLIHSDLDADNLDYLMRDATFSGTSYGIMDMGVLLNCLVVSRIENDEHSKYVVGIQKKGIGCVEQFLLNKFLAYGQMIMTKYVSILEAMLLKIESSYIIPDDMNYNCDELFRLVNSKKSELKYIAFSDSYVRQKIFDMAQVIKTFAKLPKAIVSHLANSSALTLVEEGKNENECICTAVTEEKIREVIFKSDIYQRFLQVYEETYNVKGSELGDLEAELFSFRFEMYSLTKQIPLEEFIDKFVFSDMEPRRRFLFHYYRLANGIPVLEKNQTYCYEEDSSNKVIADRLPLLCVEHPQSSLRDTYSMRYVSLRQYNVCEYAYPN